ncbi:ATP-dependent RNA helicase dhx8 isoform A [Chlorella sorokiniana]|uniref:RNA helicase n=1 Tax=Chlorella sorokiniana TaxID=3076 RepID=A0A2P6TM22_CHLSO|nr:ATP-dependent RNA helicase dhx8 isoform A [Chlorella sorokiniana]|eukprot:PRW45383.1 ATP-dependent RNA helicase dhx8 isoform A [Chlorella sorokiniana]
MGATKNKRPAGLAKEPAAPAAPQEKEGRAAKRQRLDAERRRLPAWSAREKLVELVKDNQVLVVIGETGSGKTTQIPRYLHDAGLAQGGAIACTQPRRVAAVTVAQRVAEEMGTELGGKVGYSIRFDDKTSPQTRIKYLTDGMLLREALVDPKLKRYKVVVLDEAHERTVATDVLFGLLKGVCAARPDDFRLLVMSATLDAAAFTRYFNGAQAAYIQGRQFPVQVMYTSAPEDSYVDAAITAALQVHCDERPGDILVFLTGQEEIEACERLISERGAALPPDPDRSALLVLPIYAALPPEQQLRVFEPTPPNTRKIILSTNIAETSITISGVRYVIDTGFVKSRSYSPRLGADCLQVTPISQAQARQRSGRAGREAPGKAFRLYTEASFQQLPASTLPEIQRTNLASVVLQLKALGIQDVLGFDFMDPPPRAALLRSLELLLALGALDTRGELTKPTGERLARLPVEPMYGKVLLASGEMGCAQEALAVVAMVSTDVVFHLPRGKREEAAEAHARFRSREGDHLTLLAVFRAYTDVSKKGHERASWCRAHFINPRAMRKAVDIHAQLKEHLVALGIPLQSCGEDSLPLRRALVAGLFPHAARRQMDGSYKVIATGQAVAIHPSSVLCGKKAECIVFNELVRTSKQYARDAVAIEAAWLPELAPAYFARQHANAGR